MKITVRATRGYLAGFGTSGSLLAGAAVLFVLGSAIVAFRGWPQIATHPATVAVTASHPAAPSRVARRLAVVLKGRLITGGAPIAPGGHRRVTSSVKAQTVTRGSGAPSAGGVAAPTSGSSALAAAAPCAGSGCNQPGSPGLVASLTRTVAQEISGIGSTVGSSVSSGSSAAAGGLSGTSPQAGSAVQNAGSGAGSAISGTATTAAGVVGQAGNSAGGGH